MSFCNNLMSKFMHHRKFPNKFLLYKKNNNNNHITYRKNNIKIMLHTNDHNNYVSLTPTAVAFRNFMSILTFRVTLTQA